MCKYYRQLWDRAAHLVPLRALSPTCKQPFEFPRFELWQKREPPRGHHAKCRCGGGDAWACWSKVRSRELYGMARIDDGAKMLIDRELVEEEDGGSMEDAKIRRAR